MPKKSACIAAFVTSLGIVGSVGAAQASAAPLSSPSARSTTLSAQPATPADLAYTVQPGDTLTALSERFNTTVAALADTNRIANIDVIDVGQVLAIPTGDTSATLAPVRPVATTVERAQPQRSAPLSGIWACIAAHESGGNPATNTGNGYYGMFQFSPGSWAAAGGQGNPADASAGAQLAVAQRLQARSGWGSWPVTSRECGA